MDRNQGWHATARPGKFALSGIASGVLLLLAQGAGAAQPPEAVRQQSLLQASAQHGVALDRLSLLNSAEVDFPSMGIKVFKSKVLDKSSGQVLRINVDQAGAAVSAAQLAQFEDAARENRKVHPQLARKLGRARPQDKVGVIVWLKETEQAGPSRPDRNEEATMSAQSQAGMVFARADAQRAAAVARIAAPLTRRLQQLDGAARADRFSPAIYARLPAEAVARVAQWNEVAEVYEDAVNKPDLDVARDAIFAGTVNGRGITGAGVPVAQIEVGGRVATANPNLAGVVQDATSVCSTASGHSTGVAGIIRSTHATTRGIAPAATLRAGGSCGGFSSELQSRSTAAADWGARAINLSWGSNTNLVPGANDRFYDDMVINRFRTIVKSAGNEAGPCNSGTGNVTSPGLAYNVVTVGNFDDRNTDLLFRPTLPFPIFEFGGWRDDVMSTCSSWRDPTSTHGDREKPEVAAPGTNIQSTTTASPWVGNIGSGTSFAAPMVTGTAALMMQRHASLQSWPEGVKAILMATAVHNIEGSTRLSEFDGAGGIAADRADTVAGARRTSGSYGWDARAFDCAAPASSNVAVMSLTAGVRTRAVIVWDQNPAYAAYATQPSADLDLHVLAPSGALTAVSLSWDNTYEIVDFTPTVTGNYTLRVSKLRCDMTPRWLGFAWRAGN